MSRTGKLSAAALLVLAAATVASTNANAFKARQVRCDAAQPWLCSNVLLQEPEQRRYLTINRIPNDTLPPSRAKDYTDPRDNPALLAVGANRRRAAFCRCRASKRRSTPDHNAASGPCAGVHLRTAFAQDATNGHDDSNRQHRARAIPAPSTTRRILCLVQVSFPQRR